MPVSQVVDRVPVYVIPPNRQLIIADDHLSVSEFDGPRWQRAPIDTFFRSLASHHGDQFAIILSGAGSDGSVGIMAIKEAGGSHADNSEKSSQRSHADNSTSSREARVGAEPLDEAVEPMRPARPQRSHSIRTTGIG